MLIISALGGGAREAVFFGDEGAAQRTRSEGL